MGREKKRKRSRSKTPPVEWETLLVPPVPNVVPTVEALPASSASEPQPEEKARSSRQPASDEKGAASGSKGPSEREAWRSLVVNLAALRGDPEMERLIAEKHPELQRVAEDAGATGSPVHSIEQAREKTKGWFERGLRGSNKHGPDQRAALCTRLSDILKARAADILAGTQGNGMEDAAAALRRGKAEEEGPLICALLGRELERSRYQGIWLSRSGPGRFIIGDEHLDSGLPDKDADGANIDRVIRVAIKIISGQLMVDGFFHKGETDMNPVKCQVGPFLTVYFEGLSLKEALAKWKEGLERRERAKAALAGGVRPSVVVTAFGNSQAARDTQSIKALAASLPPGWELRESRSKKGQYYYANPALGLSQHERPKA